MYKRKGIIKHSSKFICLECLKQNDVISGIKRVQQREMYHIKDCYCLNCKHITKNIECRYCDDINKVITKAKQLHYNNPVQIN